MHKLSITPITSIIACLLFCSFQKVEIVTDFNTMMPLDLKKEEEIPIFLQLKKALKERDIELIHTDLSTYLKTGIDKDVSHLVFWNIPKYAKKLGLSSFPKEKMVLFIWEPPSVHPKLYKKKTHRLFSKIYTWDDDLVKNEGFSKFNYPIFLKRVENTPSFDKRKLCVMVAANKKSHHPNELYSERAKIAAFFEEKPLGEFELYGRGWSGTCYKGEAKDKLEVISDFKFCICYENISSSNGYVSEKIFDALRAGCIPIYLGAANIETYLPKNCFIDRRDFSSNESLYTFMKNMDRKTAEKYLDSGRKFLISDEAKQFSIDSFINVFYEAVSKKK